MKICAAVLTWQQFALERHDLFKQTVRSLSGVDELFLVDNGSTDGTAEYIRGLGGYVNAGETTTCGYGMNLAAAICNRTDGDIVILSNDDIVWHEGFVDLLRDVWGQMPDDVKIVSGLLEGTFPWNRPAGLEGPVLIRETVPGGAWTYRNSDYETVFPVPTKPGWDDVPTCRRLNGQGFRVGAVDLSANLGVDKSSWGNMSYTYQTETVEQVKAAWGL